MTTVPQKTISVSLETFRDQATLPLIERAREALRKSQQYLLGLQKPEGYWVGELFVDSTLVSDKVAFMHWCGEVDFDKQSRCVKNLLSRQMPDGGWNTYYKGPSEAERHDQGLLRPEARRVLSGRPAHDQGPRHHRAPGRHPEGEHLHQALSRPVRPVSVEVPADHSARDHPAAELALL